MKDIRSDSRVTLNSILNQSSSCIGSSDILKEIKSGRFKIAIYGLGYVGASIASVWLRAGAHIIAVDKSLDVLENARRGRTHVPEPGVNEAFTKGLAEKRFEVYKDPVKASHDSYFKMICVPVSIANESTDLTALKEVAAAVGKGLKKGDAITLNSSVPPGTTEDIVIPILEKISGFKVETDFYMIYSPERIYEGRAIEDIEERYPAIVSGAGHKSVEVGVRLYSLVFKKGAIAMSNIKTAETEKLLEGVYRDVNIALANEVAKFCEKLGVDFWEVREASNSQPFCQIHKPGIGVGGACIPVYPQFILQTAAKMKINCNITRLSRTVNDSMPAYSVKQAIKLLNGKKNIAGSIVTLLGLAFRGGVSDTRFSPTYKVIEELQKLKVKEIRIHDPLARSESLSSKVGENVTLTSHLNEAVKGTNLVMLIADHPEYRSLTADKLEKAPVYDGRGMLNRSKFDSTKFDTIGVGYKKRKK